MKKHQIIIGIEGGVASVDETTIPKNIEIVIRDYDIDGADEERLSEDEEGNQCFVSVYGSVQ